MATWKNYVETEEDKEVYTKIMPKKKLNSIIENENDSDSHSSFDSLDDKNIKKGKGRVKFNVDDE